MPRIRSWVLLTSIFAVLAGMAFYGSQPGALTARAAPHDGAHFAAPSVLRISDEGISDLPDSALDPPANTLGANANLIDSLVLAGLVRLDQNLRVQPDGSDHWTVSPDRRTYTFHIRSSLKFADGTPVTAADFAYSLNRAFSPQFANAGNAEYYLSNIAGGQAVTNGKAKSVSGIQVVNPSTLRIRTITASAVFLDQLAATSAAAEVVPRRIIQRYGKSWTEHMVGTGPFYVQRLQHGRESDLAPNPYYWRGKPRLGGIHVLFIANPDTAYELYRHGGLDVMGAVQFPSDKFSLARHQSDFHQAANLATVYLTPNEKKPPFNDVHVRRAFSFAIDRNTLVNKFLAGQDVPAHTILPPGIPGYDAALRGQTFDPKQARAELAKAGYPGGKGFPHLTLSFSGGDPGQTDSSQVLQRMWSAYLGVNVSLNKMEQNAYNNLLNARSYQLAYISWTEDYPDPQNFLSLQLQTGNGNNNGSYSNATFDSLTKRADALVGNNAARFKLYHQAEAIALNQAAWLVLFHPKWDIFINKNVRGLSINGGGLTAGNWADVTVR